MRLTTASWELARLATLQDQRAERTLAAEQRDDERCAQARFERGIAQGIARPLDDVRDLQRLPLGDRLAQARFSCSDVELAEPGNDLLVEPGGLAELEAADLLAIVEDRAAIGAGEIDRTVDNGLQHDLEIECRAHRAADFAQGGEVAVARLHLLEQPRVLDGDDGLVGEGLDKLDLLVGETDGPSSEPGRSRRSAAPSRSSGTPSIVRTPASCDHADAYSASVPNVLDVNGLSRKDGASQRLSVCRECRLSRPDTSDTPTTPALGWARRNWRRDSTIRREVARRSQCRLRTVAQPFARVHREPAGGRTVNG